MLNSIRKVIRPYPRLRNLLRSTYRSGQYLTARALGKFRSEGVSLFYIDPHEIRMTVAVDDPTLTGNGVWHFGTVAEGDWDVNGRSVQTHDDIYTILHQRVQQGKAYADIPEYQARLGRIKQGELIDSSSTPKEYATRWQAIESLHEKIKQEGYQSQLELGTDNPANEIRVQIGRRGEWLFEEGLHRLCIAQLLNVPEIPVLVTRRHAEWGKLRHNILKIVLQRGFIHQPFEHPDLDDLAMLHGNELASQANYGDDRWEFIRQNLPFDSGSVLDIGAYFGYFDHHLETLGFDCTAVEPDRENLAVLKQYRAMKGRQFAVWEQSVFDIEQTGFDLVLALNIFHHLVRDEREYEQLIAFLRRLRCRAMFFEPDENAGVAAYKHFSPAEFVSFVQEHTGLSQAQYLGQAQEGRPVFLLT